MCKNYHRLFFANSSALYFHLRDFKNLELPPTSELDHDGKLKFETKAKVFIFIFLIYI